MKTLLYIFIILGVVNCYAKNSTSNLTNKNAFSYIEVIPGVSLGEIKIGDSTKSLQEKGFEESSSAFKNENFLVTIESNKVIRITYRKKDLSLLKLRGNQFPKSPSESNLRTFLKNCKPNEPLIGGYIIYCENHGVELDFSYKGLFENLSVVRKNS